MQKTVDAEKYMSKNPLTFTEKTDLFDAIHLLLERKVSGATVVNDNNEIVGVVSELDCLKAILDQVYYGSAEGLIGDIMTRQVHKIMNIEEMDILAIAAMMIREKHRRFPVEVHGKFAGQVSTRSILQAAKDFVAEHDRKEDSRFE